MKHTIWRLYYDFEKEKVPVDEARDSQSCVSLFTLQL